MRWFFPVVPSLLAILCGSILFLSLLPCASVRGGLPSLQALFGERVFRGVVIALTMILAGFGVLLYSTLVRGTDGESLPLFWKAYLLCTLGYFALLGGIAHLGASGRVRLPVASMLGERHARGCRTPLPRVHPRCGLSMHVLD
jgi:hypothetical protein